MNRRMNPWILAFAYLGFIYATLSVVVIPLRMLRQHGLLRLTLGGVYLTTFYLLIRTFIRSNLHSVRRIIALLLIFGLYGLITQKVTTPEEQFHFLEYGLVGVLFARAMRVHMQNKPAVFIGALALASAAGTLDEVIQGHLPNRHFDIHDIWLNVVSAFLGLLIFELIPKRQEN